MDSQGDFVVTWVNRTSSSDPHGQVMAEYFTANGNPSIDGRFPVFYGGGATSMDHPVVAMNGNTFVVAFEDYSTYPFGTVTGIEAQRFTVTPGLDGPSINTSLGLDAQRYWVSTSVGANATHPSIAMSPNGAFDIAYDHVWTSSPGSTSIQDTRYYFNGAFDTTFQVTGPGEVAQHPAVARDNLGNAVVVYQVQEGTWGTGIWASRISSADTLYSSQIYLEDQTGHEHNPSVAMEPSGGVGGGRFVVAFDTLDANGNSAVEAMEFSSQSSGNGRIAVFGSPTSPIEGFYSNVSMDASGNFQLTYSKETSPYKTDVFLRRGTL
jgi:hypothetical protein